MEVSTVSPRPTSPTKRLYLCRYYDTIVAIDSVTLLICLCGLAGNGAVLFLLGSSNRTKPITVYFFYLAITDFAFFLLMVTSTVLFLMNVVSCFFLISLKYKRLLFQMFLFFYILGLYLLAAISFNRCRSTSCQRQCHCRRSQHRSMVVSAMQGAISITVIPTLTLLFQDLEGELFAVILIFMYIVSLLFLASCMVMSSTTLFIKTKCGSQQQQHKRLNIVIFLMVLFALPPSVCSFSSLYMYNFLNPFVFLVTCIHCSIKPFICFLVGSCGRPCSVGSPRLSLQRVLGEPEENTTRSNGATMDTVA